MEIILDTNFIIGFMIGLPFGIISTIILKKMDIEYNLCFNIILVTIWLGLHTYGFINGTDVPLFFDLIGGMGIGHLIGFDISTIISNVIKGGKK